MDLGAILTEVAQALSSTGVQVYASVPDAGDFPALVVNPPTVIEYAERYNGSCILTVPVSVYVQTSDLASAWEMVYRLLSYNLAGSTPVIDALKNHTPTNYKVINVTTASNFRPIGESGIAVDVNLTIYT